MIGVLIVAAHAAAFAVLATRCQRDELAVTLQGPSSLDGRAPPSLADRVTIDDRGDGAGLHRRTWRVRYRGGIEREVGAVALVGPFQDHLACSGRVIVGQRLLDAGVTTAIEATLTDQLRTLSIFPIGDFVRVAHLRVRWAQLAAHANDAAFVGDAPHGYVRIEATVVFDRVTVPLTVALIPAPQPTALRFRVAVRAELAFENRAVQWLSDEVGADRLASRIAQDQIDDALVTVLAPPPPFTLSGGQTLRFSYCDEPLDIIDGAYAALPFAVVLGHDPRALPPHFSPGPRDAPAPDSTLDLDLDLDALNGVLFELWRGGFLDRQLAAAGLDRRFNADPTVASLLSVRIDPPHLRWPPVVSVDAPGTLRLGAEAQLTIHDGARATQGRVWGGVSFRIAPHAIAPIAVELDELALSCERTPSTLVACYPDLVGAIRGRASEFHGALTQTFMTLLSNIFVGRIGAAGVPADLVIRGVIPSIKTADARASLHLALDAAISAIH